MTAETTDDQMNMFKQQFEGCVIKCADDTVRTLPTLFTKMKSIIENDAYHKAG